MLMSGSFLAKSSLCPVYWSYSLLAVMLIDSCWLQGIKWRWEQSALASLAIASDRLVRSVSRRPTPFTRSGASNDIGTVVFLCILLANFLESLILGPSSWLETVYERLGSLSVSTIVMGQLLVLTITLTLARWRVHTTLLMTLTGIIFLGILSATLFQVILPSLIALLLLYSIPHTFAMGEGLLCSMTLSWALTISTLLLGEDKRPVLGALASASLLACATSIGSMGLLVKVLPSLMPRASIYFGMHLALGTGIFVYYDLPVTELILALTTSSRLSIMIAWVALLVFTLFASRFYLQRFPTPSRFQVYLNRKFYHLMTIPFFVPVLLVEHAFLSAALVLVSCLFVELEAFRVICPSGVFAHRLSFLMTKFKNSADGSGSVVLSHLYLLLGCTIPIVTSIVPGFTPSTFWAWSLGGVASLGILDAAAAIAGMLVGGPTWPASNKTMAGSMAGALSMIFFQAALIKIVGPSMSGTINWIALARQAIYCSLWEALSGDLNDNLTLPLVAMIAAPSRCK